MIVRAKVVSKLARKRLDAFQKKTNDESFRVLRNLGRQIMRSARAKAPKASGTLSKSIRLKTRKRTLLVKVGSLLPYAPAVELGSGPFYRGSNRQRSNSGFSSKGPKIGGIRPWAESKGFDPWAVRAALVRRGGTKAQPYLGPSADAARAKLEPMTARAVRTAARKSGLSTRGTR